MNILIPDSWLKEYLQTDLSPEDLAKTASLHGPSFEHLLTLEDEVVYDIEVTTNRPDLMSIKGLARELAAIMPANSQLTQPDHQLPAPSADTPLLPLPALAVKTDKLNRVLAVIVDDLKNTDSPEFMQKRLRQIGQRSQGIIIDTTNYITHELGHPCHAFDYDKLMALGGKIIITQAESGKSFTTLDGVKRQTKGGEIVFTNEAGEIIDLPAIMGTANTSIDAHTTRVLFWLENLNASSVRQASMQHAIRTQAAVLNEKSVDSELMDETLALGAHLLLKYAQGKVASQTLEYRATKQNRASVITLELARLHAYLGISLPTDDIKALLARLGFSLQEQSKTALQFVVPSWRQVDVSSSEDLIEEVARLYGYHLLPSKTDFPQVQIPHQENFYFSLEKRCKHFLATSGLTEVYTYSMVAPDLIAGEAKNYLALENPLTDDRVYLRQSLWPSLEQVWRENPLSREHTLGIFELAKIYLPEKTSPQVKEVVKLAWLLALPYRQARELLEKLLANFYLSPTIDETGKIFYQDKLLGRTQIISRELSLWELDIATLGASGKLYPQLQALSNKPVLVEELTFALPANAKVGNLMQAMGALIPQLHLVELIDIYHQHYSFRFTYQDPTTILSRHQVAKWRQLLVAFMKEHQGELVGTLEPEQ